MRKNRNSLHQSKNIDEQDPESVFQERLDQFREEGEDERKGTTGGIG